MLVEVEEVKVEVLDELGRDGGGFDGLGVPHVSGPGVLAALDLGADTVGADPARIDGLGHGLVEGLVAIGAGAVEHEQGGSMEAADREREVLGGGLGGKLGHSEGDEEGLGQQEIDLRDDNDDAPFFWWGLYVCVRLCSLV